MDEVARLNWLVPLLAFVLAAVFGAIAQRFNFCTMGAIADIVNFGDWRRMRMWLLAIAVAIVGTTLLATSGLIDLSKTIYTTARFPWLSHLVGGLLFGFGMTLGSGCGSKTLIRVGGGNLKSLVVTGLPRHCRVHDDAGRVRAAAGVRPRPGPDRPGTDGCGDLRPRGPRRQPGTGRRGEALVALPDRARDRDLRVREPRLPQHAGDDLHRGRDRRRHRRRLVRLGSHRPSRRGSGHARGEVRPHEHGPDGIVLARGADRVPPGVADPLDRRHARRDVRDRERARHDRGRRRDGARHAHVPLGRFREHGGPGQSRCGRRS